MTPELRVFELARELCAAEGWEPDELVECEPELAVAAVADPDGTWRCRRWELYARAAARLAVQPPPAAAAMGDDWDTF
jgi:hypothetical protein